MQIKYTEEFQEKRIYGTPSINRILKSILEKLGDKCRMD
jgi:hypothetical protein